MELNFTLLAQALAFAGLTWIIATKIWPPLLNAIEARQQQIAEGLAAAERSQKELAQVQHKVDDILRQALVEANEIITKADLRATQLVEQARIDALAEGARQISKAKAEIDAGLFRAREDLRRQMGAIAVAGAGRVIKREIDARAHEALLEELLAQI